MKRFGLVIMVLFPLLSFAQLTLAVQAGANVVTPHLSKQTQFSSTKSGVGWQAGMYTAYQKHKLFVYSGLNAAQYNFSENEGIYQYTYHPTYLQIPAGIGYKMNLHKTKSLAFYGGVQGLLGIAGSVQQPLEIICITFPCIQPTNRFASNIKYGKSENSYQSFARTAANLQVGTTVTLSNSIAASASYAWGITNTKAFSDDYSGTTHLRVWDVSVRYYLVH